MQKLISAASKYPVLAVASLIALVAVGAGVYNWFRRKRHSNVPNDKSDLRLHSSVYDTKADLLEAAMNRVGTDEATLFEVLEGLNDSELIEVFNRFGVRTNNDGSPSWFGNVAGALTGNLIAWFLEELSGADLRRMKERWSGTGLWS